MSDQKFHIGLVQMSCALDPNENFAKAEWKIREAAARGAQIVCLQELFRSQYFCREENAGLFALAEPIPGPSTDSLGKLAARTRHRRHRVSVREARRRASITTPLQLLAPTEESRGFTARCTSPTIRSTSKNITSPPAISDSRISIRPSAASASWSAGTSGIRKARASPRWAARTFCSIPPPSAGIPAEKAQYGAAQLDAWRTIQRSHAIANGIYVAAVNRVGYEGPPDHGLEFWGSSFVADPFGQLIAEASTDKEEILVVECDPRRSDEVRRNWPFLRDRRIDAYGPIVNRWLGK